MFRKIKAGETSQSIPIFVSDTSSNVGAGLGSLVFNSSGLAAKYRRQGQSSWTTISLATMTLGTWASGGFVSDGGPVTGGYEFGIPNACLASSAGVEWVEIALYGATNMLAVLIFIELDQVDYQDAADFGLSNLDAAVSSRSTYAGGAVASVTNPVTLTSAYDAAKTAAQAGDEMTLHMTQLVPMRDLTGVTAPNVGDALNSAVSQAAGAWHRTSPTEQDMKNLDGSTFRNFDLTLNDDGDPTARD